MGRCSRSAIGREQRVVGPKEISKCCDLTANKYEWQEPSGPSTAKKKEIVDKIMRRDTYLLLQYYYQDNY